MYGIHFDHHTLSIARDGELLASEPLAVETGAEPRAGTAALATARGRPDEVSLNHWRELGKNEMASRNVARELIARLHSLGVADRGHYIILEAGWRSATAARVAGGAECVVEEAFFSEKANLLDVYDLWLIG